MIPYNGDTLVDWEEVDTTRLIWNEDGSFEIPTFNVAELVNHLTRFQSSDYNFLSYKLTNNSPRHYLPILSDPTIKDSDGDGVEDWDEEISKRLKFNEFAFVFYDNEEFSEQGIDEGKYLKSKNSKLEVRATPHKERLTPLLCICLENFRHFTQIFLAIRQYCCVKFMQSDENFHGASAQQSLCGVALEPYL